MNDNFLFGNEKRLILIADDEYVNREILANILEGDYDIIFVEDGLDDLIDFDDEDEEDIEE